MIWLSDKTGTVTILKEMLSLVSAKHSNAAYTEIEQWTIRLDSFQMC